MHQFQQNILAITKMEVMCKVMTGFSLLGELFL